jgi:hypothetical protein
MLMKSLLPVAVGLIWALRSALLTVSKVNVLNLHPHVQRVGY